MPRNEYCPRFALLSGFDARQWASVDVFSRGGSAITVDSTAADAIFLDAVQFLNGYGSEQSLEADCQAAATAAGAAGNWTIGIDTDDKVYIENDAAGFRVVGGLANEPYGFSTTADQDAALVAGTTYRATAPNDWVRGEYLGRLIEINFPPPGYGSSFTFGRTGQIQDVRIALRDDGATGDVDDVFGTLQQVDNAVTVTTSTRWGIDSDGHVYCTTAPLTGALTWIDTDFRDRLGFDGTETPTGLGVLYGSYDILLANNPLPGALFPSRPLDSLTPVSESVSTEVQLLDGSVSSNYVTTFHRWAASAYLDGPSDVIDLHRHWHFKCKQHLYGGARATLYQDWGDSRRSGWRESYSLLYTPEAVSVGVDEGGYRGRVIGTLTQDVSVTDTTWPERLRRRSPFNFSIRVDPTV